MKKEFPALTGIRAIAAILVFLHHYAQTLYANETHGFAYYLLRQLNIGVNVFFVLSGFLITYRYYPLPVNLKSYRHYWWKRAVRIFPLYYGVLILQLVLIYVHQHALPDLKSLFLSFTLLKGLSESSFYSVMTQSWSLTVEEMFYLYAPLCFFLIRKRYVFAQIALLFATGFFLAWASQLQNGSEFFGGRFYMLAGTFFGRCFEFFVGVGLAFWLSRQKTMERSGRLYTVAGGTLFCLLLLALAAFAYAGRIENINLYWIGICLFNFLIPLSVGLFFYGLICEKSRVQNILSSKAFDLLGKSSYAFYLLHIGMLAEVIYFHVTSNLLLLFVLLQFFSVCLYKFSEKPRYFLSFVRTIPERMRGLLLRKKGESFHTAVS